MEFEPVLSEYRKLIWHIINNFVKINGIPFNHTDDIFQEVCVRLHAKLPTYDSDISTVKTFVVNTTEIVCMRYRRDYNRHFNHALAEDDEVAQGSTFESLSETIDGYEADPEILRVIYDKLYGYTQQEIAKKYGISQSTVSRTLSEFRDYLVTEMKK